MIRFRLPMVTLVVGALALYIFGRWENAKAAKADSAFDSAHFALAIGKAHRGRIAKFAALAKANADSARAWRQVAVVRGVMVAKLDTALKQSTTAQDSIGILLLQRDTLKAQLTLWQAIAIRFELADRADSSRAAIAEERNTYLEAQLVGVLAVAECHIAGIHWLPKCPSRTASFVLGGAAVGTLALLRH